MHLPDWLEPYLHPTTPEQYAVFLAVVLVAGILLAIAFARWVLRR